MTNTAGSGDAMNRGVGVGAGAGAEDQRQVLVLVVVLVLLLVLDEVPMLEVIWCQLRCGQWFWWCLNASTS